LLDDPLAALDPRIGRTVFQECILGTLYGKTRVLVTQALQFLPQVDHIIVVDDGTIVEQGSYAQLYRANGQLRKMIDGMKKRSKDSSKKRTAAQDIDMAKNEVKRDEHASSTITSVEDVVTGAISAKTWWGYLKAAGGWVVVGAMFIALLVQQAGAIMMNQWLQWWTRNEFNDKIGVWIGIYNGIGVAVALLLSEYQFSHDLMPRLNVNILVLVNICILIGVLNASRSFHNRAFAGVLGAPMSWFHANPAGRVINRFSIDVQSIDQRLMPLVFQAIANSGSLVTAITLISRSAPVLICKSDLSTSQLATDFVNGSSSKCFHDS
jgi:ATP-binding cassette, subfamily C (CFTR/MRP), member 1